MPIIGWSEIYETENFAPLLKNRTYGKVGRYAPLAFTKIQDELIDNFGISNDYKNILRKRIKIELLYLHQFKTKDKSNQLLIEIEEAEIEAIKKTFKKSDIHMSIIAIEKAMGIKIAHNELTIYDFYKYTKYLMQQNG
jgi:hypothetical protein